MSSIIHRPRLPQESQPGPALIEQLRAQESADIRQFKQDTTTQLRAQVAKVTALTAQLQALTAQNADLDSRLVASQLRERSQALGHATPRCHALPVIGASGWHQNQGGRLEFVHNFLILRSHMRGWHLL